MTTSQIASLGEPGLRAFREGLAAQQAGRGPAAIEAYRRALRQHPGLAPAHFNLGQLLRERGDYRGAAVAFEGAARLRPTAADAWLNLGAMLERIDRHHDAVAAYQRAAACLPADPTPQYNRGNALLALGDFPGAAEAFRAVIEAVPDHSDAQWNLATALLAQGKFLEGWAHYRWRWAKQGLDPAARFPWPLWNGEAVADRRILVWREQGIGDELLFATCLRELVAAGAEVTLVASPRLTALFQRAFPSITVVAEGKLKTAGTHFDWQIPIGELPRFLRRARSDFPTVTKFLVPDSSHATRWANRLDKLGAGPKVGICWRSGLLTEERRRDFSELRDWKTLLELPEVHWINLQYDDCAAEIAAVEALGVTIHRWRSEDLKNDLESVVGLLWNLDAVVTAPTAVSSLAGGAAIPTWEVDSGRDWTAHGEDRSPWFPSIQVFRRRRGTTDWLPVIERVAEDLTRTLGLSGRREAIR
jgi:hypothetical protein